MDDPLYCIPHFCTNGGGWLAFAMVGLLVAIEYGIRWVN